MLSESARMSSAAEARFRVQASPSTPRATTVIALDAAGEGVVRRLAMAGWEHATFLTVVRSARLQADCDSPANAPGTTHEITVRLKPDTTTVAGLQHYGGAAFKMSAPAAFLVRVSAETLCK